MSAGKGDKRRPSQVSFDQFANNWDAIFGKPRKKKKKCGKQASSATDVEKNANRSASAPTPGTKSD